MTTNALTLGSTLPRTWIRALLATEHAPSLTLTRIALGLVILPHGAQHLLGWFGGYGFAGTVSWMTHDLGIPLPFAVLAVLTEFLAPFALVAGLAGRLAGLGIAGLMAVAATTHASNGFFMNWVGSLPAGAEGFEYHLLAMAMGLAVALGGSGAWSVDRRFVEVLRPSSRGSARRTSSAGRTERPTAPARNDPASVPSVR
jgi:putative oxidoreductase